MGNSYWEQLLETVIREGTGNSYREQLPGTVTKNSYWEVTGEQVLVYNYWEHLLRNSYLGTVISEKLLYKLTWNSYCGTNTGE